MGVMCMPNPKTYDQTLQLLFSCPYVHKISYAYGLVLAIVKGKCGLFTI
jgi:hypothetical protein